MTYIDPEHTNAMETSRDYRDWYERLLDLKNLIDYTVVHAQEGSLARYPGWCDDRMFLLSEYTTSVRAPWARYRNGQG